MTTTNSQGLVERPGLNEQELQEVQQLASLCNAYEGLDLKLALGGPPPGSDQEINRFLYYQDGALIGFCGLDYEELCGMVHPEYRRKGIGKVLLLSVINEYKRRSIPGALIICEEVSQSGKGFVATTGARFDFAEHHMELEVDTNWRPPTKQDSRLHLSKATFDDLDALTTLTAASFGGAEEVVRRRLEHDLQSHEQWFYIARLEDAPISTLKVFPIGGKIGVYAFGILPEYRGKGFGKQVLVEIIESLRSENWSRFALEVETDNKNAISLYKSCGFKETTTYGYYKLEKSEIRSQKSEVRSQLNTGF